MAAAASRTAIVTGGSSGIGRAVCHSLGKAGFRVFACGRNEAALQATVDEVNGAGGSASYGIGDVGDEAVVTTLYGQAVEFFGQPPDVLVANAGVGRFGPLETITPYDFDLSFRTNVRGVFLWLQAVLPEMKERKSGQIVVMSSVAGLRAGANGGVYSATKFALQGMMTSLRAELKGTGVKSGTVNPGAVATEWWIDPTRGGKAEPASEEKLATMLTAEDVATATMVLIDQAATSNVEMVSLEA
mmetsp:Transcript_6455/g.19140  ORF Transcript_6455/g.19140 Transcript_6455/m.19140 type:complete len:244 (+) Transcript_6455:24-755(+)